MNKKIVIIGKSKEYDLFNAADLLEALKEINVNNMPICNNKINSSFGEEKILQKKPIHYKHVTRRK